MSEIEKQEKNFENHDKLKREAFSKNLNKIILSDNAKYTHAEDESLVIAINSSWGTGKTFFLDMWENMLKNEEGDNLQVIRYNSWENDDWHDAFVPILSKLIKEFSKTNSLLADNIKINFKNIAKYIAKGVAKSLIEKIDNKLANEIFDFLKELTSDNFTEWIQGLKEYEEFKTIIKKLDFNELIKYIKPEKLKEFMLKKKVNLSIIDEFDEYTRAKTAFKNCIKKISNINPKKKIVFILDELDRCRPNFAIETLETIKHFMNIPNVVYVFAIDMEQLSHSIATHYGQNMDSQGYLRRFFHLNFSLNNNSKNISNYVKSISYGNLNSNCQTLFIECANLFQLSLRDINVIYKNILIMHDTIFDQYYREEIIFFYYYMLILKQLNPSLYNMILFGYWTLDSDSLIQENLSFLIIPKLSDAFEKLSSGKNKLLISEIEKEFIELEDDKKFHVFPWYFNTTDKMFSIGDYIDNNINMLSQ